MRDGDQIQVNSTAATLPEALTDVLRQLIAHIAAPGAAGALTGTIQAETPSAAGLLPRLTESLTGLIDDFEATPLDISIDGLRWLDGRVRAWGTVTLSRERLIGPVEIEWIGLPMVEQMEDGWRIEGQTTVIGPAQDL